MKWLRSRFVPFLGIVLLPVTLLAQTPVRSTPLKPGSSQDSIQTPSLRPKPDVTFKARDSLKINLREQRVARLFGAAKVEHKEGTLESGVITLDLNKKEMEAKALSEKDTLSQPVLRRNNEEIRSVSIRFNYETQKGRFEVAKVRIDQGNITGGQVKNITPHVVFIQDAMYSTCTLDHPHFYVKADRMKIVDQEEVYFTKARLFILDIPYPIVFPYGYFPGAISKKKSGLLPIVYSFQQQQDRGLGLQNLGWFQYFNDYLTGSIAMDAFTSGTFYGRSQMRYALNRDMSGSVSFGYSLDQGMEPTDPDFVKRRQNRFQVQHNQRFSPFASVTADVNLQTAEFLKRNSINIDDRAEVSTQSFISYRYNHPEQLFTFNADLRQSQNFLTNTTDLSGPSTSFSLKTLTPFRSQNVSLKPKWYESLTINYSNKFQSAYRFKPLSDTLKTTWFEALLDPETYKKATADDRHIDLGFKQDAQMSVQLASGEAVQVSLNASTSQVVLPYTVQQYVQPDSNITRMQTVKEWSLFNDGYAGVSINSRFYGIWNQRIGSLTSFRHTLSPAMDVSFRPDFGSSYWDYYRRPIDVRTGQPYIPTDPVTGTPIDNYFSRFERNVFGASPARGSSQVIGFSIANIFEAKQVARDTTGEEQTKVLRLIDNLNLSTSYNVSAKEFKWSPMQVTFSSSIIQGLNINANAAFDFYKTDENGQRLNTLLITSDRRPFRLTQFNINSGTQFSSAGFSNARGMPVFFYPRSYDPFNQAIFNPFDPVFNQTPMSTLDLPWSVAFNFSYSWSKGYQNEVIRNAILQASNIQLRLTPLWDLRTRLGYDFISKKLTPAEFNLNRNLHCWDLSFQWNPFGDFKYYYFSLKVNNSTFQGIFQKLPGLNVLDQGSNRVLYRQNNYF